MRIIGISGVATSGKDTLCQLIIEHFKNKNIESKRLALADKLKEDLYSFVKEKLDINLFNPSKEEKSIVRPFLVSYGKIKRILSEGKHWTNLLNKDLEELMDNNINPIITDIRYSEYDEDEFFWLKEKNGILIHITRTDENNEPIEPANKEEHFNDKKLRDLADIRYSWSTEKQMCNLYGKHISLLEEIYYATI
jgi:hypothetical protein